MIRSDFFISALVAKGIDFFTGVPDSLLKYLCAYIASNLPDEKNCIAANEGNAIAIAAGYYLATRKIAAVYMQNSGLGNAINPLLSLTDPAVYNIPLMLIIGWRGEPGVKDEPQHITQGELTISLLETIGIKQEVLSTDESIAIKQIANAAEYMKNTGKAFAFIIRKNTFDYYSLPHDNMSFSMTRERALEIVMNYLEPSAIVVSTTGMLSRELFELREAKGQDHNQDFLTVGSMGHASQIALGIALQKKNRIVYCFDGDGALIMHAGSLAIIAQKQLSNFRHIIFNNGAHDSVGGQPTVALQIDLPSVAKAFGYKHVFSVSTEKELNDICERLINLSSTVFIEIKVNKGARADLGRPTISPVQNKRAFMEFIENE